MRQIHKSITSERVTDACRRAMTTLENPGFCISCGKEVEGVEPDARNYQCEYCEEKTVFGVEEVIYILFSITA